MTQSIQDVIKNTKEIFLSDSALVTLLDFERVLSDLDLYTFKNWKNGELVIGPENEKYFVTCTFMWPYKQMPDPRGGERLLGYDCEVSYGKSFIKYPVKVKSQNDFEPGTRYPKFKKLPVWLVEITIPRDLMKDIQQGSVEIENNDIDFGEVEQAYQDGVDEDELTNTDDTVADFDTPEKSK